MIYVYTLCNIVIVAAVIFFARRRRLIDERMVHFYDFLEDAILKIYPDAFQEPTENLNEALAQNLPNVPDNTDLLFSEYMLKKEVHEIAMSILNAHDFGISYGDAYERAEDVVTSIYQRKDLPISAKLKALIPDGQGKVIQGGRTEPFKDGNAPIKLAELMNERNIVN